MPEISQIRAREVLDSRGNPTVEVDVFLEGGAQGRAIVPSGASTGKAEALELRDGDPRRYHGRGVLRAVSHVTGEIADALHGCDAMDQAGVDQTLGRLDGTANKTRLGANAMLGVSLAVAHAAAASQKVPLYRYLNGGSSLELPVPMINIMSGGMHGGGNIDFQDYQVIPLAATRYSEALHHAGLIYRAMGDVLKSRGVYRPGVADEGGYAPALSTNEQGFQLMVEAIERAGFVAGRDAAIAVDVAASHFWSRGRYNMAAEGSKADAAEMVRRLADWSQRYPILSIEDGLAEDDWEGWRALTEAVGSRVQLIGDDLFVTNPARLQRGIEGRIANAILIKMNQIGTLTETLEVVRMARQHGYRTVVSARSGETEDVTIADLAVATGAGQIKIGALTRSERLAKYNRLLRIEEQLGTSALYRGASVFEAFVKRAIPEKS
ncbi:MAG TPA: phosphopyruvate hydratase [Terriglobia bacterium]|nr:phosphopyruvate hydratase [Terriglobia bacterium]